MRAGLLDTPVTFLRRVDAASPYGKGSVTWEEALTTRARVQQQRGALTARADEPFYEQRLILTVRIYHAISPEWRVRLYGREWQQVSPALPDKRMQCQTIEITPVNK